MLGVKKYPQKYVDSCRSKVESDMAAYRKLVAAARKAASGKTQLDPAIDAFESTFFNNLVVSLDAFFVHRLRGVEGKDGNPLNEVRVLCNSLMANDGIMTPDTTIKMSPERSVLKYEPGDEIKLTEEDFVLLSKAFFAEMESKFV
jgi:hypothetical protein